MHSLVEWRPEQWAVGTDGVHNLQCERGGNGEAAEGRAGGDVRLHVDATKVIGGVTGGLWLFVQLDWQVVLVLPVRQGG